MRIIQTIAAFCLAAAIVACGQQPAAQAPAQTPAPAAAATPPPVVIQPPPVIPVQAATNDKPGTAAPSGQVTAAMLIGRWGDNGDCTKDIFFRGDGTFRSYTGGGGSWSISGDTVTMSGSGGTFTVRVQLLNDSQLRITNPDGSIGVSQRC